MILKDLEYICEVARQENLSEAAKNLSISQPALSLFVTNLENELGIRLFTREKNRLRISPEGKIYVQTATEMLDVRNRLYAQLQALKSQQKIRIGLATSYGFHIFSQVLASRKEVYADADISVAEGRAFSLLHLLQHLELDFIIVARDKLLNLPDCHVELIRPEPFALFLSPDHPVLKAHPEFAVPVGELPPRTDLSYFRADSFILSPKETSDGIVATEILNEYCPGFHVFCNINNTNSIMEMVKNQLGISLMPIGASLSCSTTRELCWCLPEKNFYRYLQMIRLKSHQSSSLEKRLIQDILDAYHREHLEKLSPPEFPGTAAFQAFCFFYSFCFLWVCCIFVLLYRNYVI